MSSTNSLRKFLFFIYSLFFCCAMATGTSLASKNKNKSTSFTCKDLNSYLMKTRYFIDNPDVTQNKEDRIFYNFLAQIDPLKIYFLKEDVDVLREYFGFDELTEEKIYIKCERIQNIAKIKAQRAEEMSDYVEQISYEDIRESMQGGEAEFTYHYDGDYALTIDDLVSRWSERIQLEFFFIEESLKGSKTINQSIERVIQNHFKIVAKNASIDKDYTHYYNAFIHALLTAYDPFARFYPAHELQQQIMEFRQTLNTTNQVDYSLDNQLIFYRNIEEPFWRILGNKIENSPYLAEGEVVLPGDIVVGLSMGKYNSVFDISSTFSPTYLRILQQAPHKKLAKKLFILRPTESGTFRPLMVSMKTSSYEVAGVDGVLRFQAHAPEHDLEIMLFKLPNLPIENSHLRQVAQESREELITSPTIFRKALDHRPDVLLIDFRNYATNNAAYNNYEAAQNFMHYLLPPDEFMGFVRHKQDLASEEESFTVISQKPEDLSEEEHQYLFDVPLVILTSPLTKEYEQWVVDVLRSYRRAVVVGGQETLGKDTAHSMLPGKILPGGMMQGFFEISNIRLYGPTGQSRLSEEPPKSDVVLPFALPSPFPYAQVFDQEEMSIFAFDSLLPQISGERDKTPDEVVARLNQRSVQRIAEHPFLKKIQELTSSLSELLLMRPESIPLNEAEVEHIKFTRSWDSYDQNMKASKKSAALAQHLITRDHLMIEAMNVAADYWYILQKKDFPDENLKWRLEVDPDLLKSSQESPLKQQRSKNSQKSKAKGFD